jgi:hypothetical protein
MADNQFGIGLVAKDPRVTQAPQPGVGTPPRDQRSSDIALIEIAKLQSDAEHLKQDLGETRGDMRDIRDRMTRLEVRVDHLPSKGFIVAVVTAALAIATGLATVAPKLQSIAGTAPTANRAAPTSPN